jgi:hypothetical protein
MVTKKFPDVSLDVYVDAFVAEKIATNGMAEPRRIEAAPQKNRSRNNTARQRLPGRAPPAVKPTLRPSAAS